VHVADAHGDMLCSSGFVYDVIMCIHVAIDHNKHNNRNSNQILLNDKDHQQVFIVSCAPGAKSAVYDCLVRSAKFPANYINLSTWLIQQDCGPQLHVQANS